MHPKGNRRFPLSSSMHSMCVTMTRIFIHDYFQQGNIKEKKNMISQAMANSIRTQFPTKKNVVVFFARISHSPRTKLTSLNLLSNWYVMSWVWDHIITTHICKNFNAYRLLYADEKLQRKIHTNKAKWIFCPSSTM